MILVLPLLATSALVARPVRLAPCAPTPPLELNPTQRHVAHGQMMTDPADDVDEGNAIFRPYEPGEENRVEVPESSKRLFALILAFPALALLAGIATYNPTDDELEQEKARKALQLRGGSDGLSGPLANVSAVNRCSEGNTSVCFAR